jgi:D-glycero-alpha-D-manno-heptose-7-phosphate kinase
VIEHTNRRSSAFIGGSNQAQAAMDQVGRQAVHARAPVRLDLAGGWTDVPPFCDREGGAVVNVAINRYAYASAKAAGRGVRLTSADYGRTLDFDLAARPRYDGDLDLLKACVRLAVDTQPPPFELFVRTDAPPGSGTGSSGSVGVAAVAAVAGWCGRRLAAHEAAGLAWRAEREELDVAGGTQDQYAAAYGGANFMAFRGSAVAVSPLRLAPRTVAELEKRLVLCYTGVSRVSGDIIDVVMGAYEEGRRETVEALRTMRALAEHLKTDLLHDTVSALGEALADNWRCQRALHPSVTNGVVDPLFETAQRAGALGGKALGAGGGGCLLFFAAQDREHEVRQALSSAGAQIMEFGLDHFGLQVWAAD